MTAVGIDGCKSGWVATSLLDSAVNLFSDIEQIVAAYGEQAFYLIDIPIGLPTPNRLRVCEKLARAILKSPRSTSVFNVPCREAVYAGNYFLAQKLNRQQLGLGLSKQTWNITSKIKEVDQFLQLNPGHRNCIKEAHPELCFYGLNARVAMKYGKKCLEGKQERLAVLRGYHTKAAEIFRRSTELIKKKDALPDDIIDCLCLCITAEQIITTERRIAIPTNVEQDELGIEMSMSFWMN